MATLNLGRLKPVFRSTWNSSTAYNVDDIVVRNNQSYISIQAGTNQDPATATAYWTLMAAKGSDGTDVGATLTTQGDVLYRDGSGLQRLAAGTSGQFLKTQGTGANPVWGTITTEMVELAHGQITSTTASLNVDVSFDDTTYMAYKMIGTYKSNAGSNYLKMRIRQAGSTITTSHYNGVIDYSYRQMGSTSGASYGAYENNDHMRISDWKTDNANDFRYIEMTMGNYMQDTSTSTGKPLGFSHISGKHSSGYYPSREQGMYYYHGNSAAITGFHFFLSADSFTKADFKFYGFKL